ncbi:hypothetical protein AKJ09_07132 [Labilithrix luteola]|uniref:Uncharacterized protein n=1 Tax=Labilithrix luteola TaxID=1391654 RepID=A0A0K1Q412_9BACT|nr:hypothetical protein AKJ09_07132 [Labilithrix luteola]
MPSVIMIATLVGAGAFAAGRSTSSAAPAVSQATIANADAPPMAPVGAPLGAPSMADNQALPPGHPSIPDDPGGPNGPALDAKMLGGGAAGQPAQSELSWKAPPRWLSVPNTSSMRLATYKIPRAAGDTEDAELSVMQAGGSIDANISRWIDQFGEEGKRTAKRATTKAGALEVVMVDIEGTYGGGMSKDARPSSGWALYGAIVATPGMPHFFKMTGPTRTVKAAHAELDQLVASLATR